MSATVAFEFLANDGRIVTSGRSEINVLLPHRVAYAQVQVDIPKGEPNKLKMTVKATGDNNPNGPIVDYGLANVRYTTARPSGIAQAQGTVTNPADRTHNITVTCVLYDNGRLLGGGDIIFEVPAKTSAVFDSVYLPTGRESGVVKCSADFAFDD